MRKIDRLTVKYHGRIVGLISLTFPLIEYTI